MKEDTRAGKPSERFRAGRAGEDEAVAWLEQAGLAIIARNFRSRIGEVDIIAREGETIVFVEVKRWSAFGAEALDQGIDGRKQRRIIETAKYFLAAHREYNSMAVRFDVIFINHGALSHIPSAFGEFL
ncbi:MAG: YraN family protein [Treponema sp.]|nr:YraN family protein [Treponema sp.]